MVQVLVRLNDYADRVLNIVKATYGFKRKDEAINFTLVEYAQDVLEPQLRPEYVKKALKISAEKPVRVENAANLRKRYES